MKKFQFLFLLALVSFLMAACAGSFDTSSNTNANTSRPSAPQARDEAAGSSQSKSAANTSAPSTQVSLDQPGQSQPTPAPVERKIIRNADLTLEADTPDEVQAKITSIAESKGGFVIESQKQSNDTKTTKADVITMTVRVPAARFDESLDEIRKSVSRVLNETVKGQDVTEEFIDIEARLKTQKALEAQFLEIMKQARTVEDALNVQSEIAKVRGEIERIEGRKRFLENQSAFSTLKIRIQTPTSLSPSSSGFFYQLVEAVSLGFGAAMQFVLGLITVVIALLPFLIFIVLPIYLLIRYFVRKARRQKAASEIAREEIGNS
jgi:Na+-transporting methylmalonyl-CoA/oxaloacetate decarboxylase gamma subunit